MLNPKMEKALNEQINAELYSAYLYLSMAAYFEDLNLKGFGNWMKVQNLEETFHAMKLYGFIIDRGGKVKLQALKGPKTAWKSPLDAFQDTLKHEQLVTSLINDLVYLAVELKDRASEGFLQWYVAEQVEEEAAANGIIQQLKLVGDNGAALIMLDREFGARTFTPPASGA